jgi:hypothetical protein
MPIQYDVDHGRRRVTVVLTPPVELQDALALLKRQAADGVWPYSVIYDIRAIPPDRTRISALVAATDQLSATYGRRGAVAIVASLPVIGEAQSYAILERHRQTIEVFWNSDDAERWLDMRTHIT